MKTNFEITSFGPSLKSGLSKL